MKIGIDSTGKFKAMIYSQRYMKQWLLGLN